MNLLKALIFGITLGLAVGPIALLILNNGLKHGLGSALQSALGASLADFTYGLAALLIGARIVGVLETHAALFALASSLVLAGFGLWMLRGALAKRDEECCREAEARGTGVFGTFLLTIVNPLTIVGFLAFTGQLKVESYGETVLLAAVIAFGTFLVGAVIGLFAAALNRVLHDPRYVRALNAVSGAGIALFGIYGVTTALMDTTF